MKHTPNILEHKTIRTLPQANEHVVTLRGWVYGKRTSGKLIFLLVRDGTGLCQCIVEARHTEAFEAAKKAGQESSLIVTGLVRLDARAPGGCEVLVESISLVQAVEQYPITRKPHGTDFLMNHRHLWLRSPRQTAILRVRHVLIQAMRSFFDDRGFTLIDTPILSPGAAEGAGTLFPVEYFDHTVYLAQTGQLYLESAAMALGRVYCFGPTFRAEKSKTRRHLTEFWMIEPEIAWAELPDLMELAESFLVHIVQAALREARAELTLLERDLTPLENIRGPFPRITYTEAVDMLHSDAVQESLQRDLERDAKQLMEKQETLKEQEQLREQATKEWQREKLDRSIHALREDIRELDVLVKNRPRHMEDARRFTWGHDLGGDEETIISRQFDQPVIITEYPKAVKAFYMKPKSSNPDVVLNMDVIAPEGYGEIIGGSQREDDLDALARRIKEENMDPAPYEWYLDLRRYGSVPHGGFGLGLERTVSWICGLRHIRETIPFPRLMGRMYP
jgi:asparaginyl-tRNA synthetase